MQLPAVGDVFAGKYAIEAIVGRGGMGVVLAARHLELDERVAIKLILSEDGPKSADFVARFVREAKLASKIKNEHVVRVIDVARLESGEPYIVMELLEGQDLSDILAERGPFPVDQAALFLLQACEAIAEAHALGIVHRDLKPANMFLTVRRDGQPCVKVLDFGISKLVGAGGGAAMTKTNALMGSPYYMSPDQLVQSKDVDARADVWALGVILFELLTKKYPFDAEDAPQLIAHILHMQPASLASFRPDAPPELVALVEATLVKDRAQRIPDVAEFSRRLAAFAPDAGRYSLERITGVLGRTGAPQSMPSSSAWSAASTGPATASGMSRSSTGTPATAPSITAGGATLSSTTASRSNRTPLVYGTTGLAILLTLGGVALLRSRNSAPPPVASVPVSVAPSPAPVAPEPTAATAAPPTPSVMPAVAPTPSASAPAAPAGSAEAAAARLRAAAKAASTTTARPKTSSPHAAADPFGGVR
jgi:serine/threonine-protein kinase